MRWLRVASMRLRSLFGGGRMDDDVDEEIRYHLERQTELNIAAGMAPGDARQAARRVFGGVAQRKEECRDARRVALVEDGLHDARYALRTLGRSPWFSAAAIVTLALGIGANVAVFTIVHGVLLRPLPFPDPDRLFLVFFAAPGPFIAQPGLVDRHYLAFRAADRLFDRLASFASSTANLTAAGEPAVVSVAGVTPDFFAALRVGPALGRTFTTGDDLSGSDAIVIVSDKLWRSRLGADPAIVGAAITLDGIRRTVVGIMPPGFNFPAEAEAWTPLAIRSEPGWIMMRPVLGRLKPGVSVQQARAELAAFVRQLPDAEPDRASWVTGVVPLKELLVRDVRYSLEIFAAAVAFVLLIACANVANLLLARAAARQREIDVRAALGASRRRLIRQLLTESVVVSLAGGICGIVLARWGVPVLLTLAPAGRIPRLEMIRIDGPVLAFALAISLATGVLFGVVPALRMTGSRLRGSLLPGGRTPAASQERFRAALVIAEIALALVLLTGAGLLLRSFVKLRAVDVGFEPKNVIALTVDLPESEYPSPERLRAFHTAMLGRLSALPDVIAAGAVNWRPLDTILIRGDFQLDDGRPLPQGFVADKPAISPGYFHAMGLRLVRGRDFTEHDNAAAPRVAIVSGTVARVLWPGADPIGRRISMTDHPKPEDWITIVGIVDDIRQLGPREGAHPAVYQPYLQVDQPFFLSHMTFAVRTASDPLRVAPAVRAALRAVDKNQPARTIASMEDVLAATTAEPRFEARLLGAFAFTALVLACLGTYSVLAYAVAQRTHEIGVRMALGAPSGAVLWMVLRRTFALAAAGVALGTAGAFAATRMLATVLFDVTPSDPPTFAAAALTILCAALAAGLIPARRATRVDPLVALRHE
jgi:predicted permease